MPKSWSLKLFWQDRNGKVRPSSAYLRNIIEVIIVGNKGEIDQSEISNLDRLYKLANLLEYIPMS